MNILQILPELHVGGVETGTVDLARALVSRGHKAVVVSYGGELVKELEAAGAVHYQLPVHKKSLWTIVEMVPRLVEIIQKEQIEIVHARSRVPAWIAYFACRRTQAALVTTCHGYYGAHPFSRAMGWGKRVIVLSNVIGRHMIDDFNVAPERIRLVPRSVDLTRFSFRTPAEKRREVFNVGIISRLTPIKGHLHFFKAMAKVARTVPQLKIWVVGGAPSSKDGYREQVEVLVRRLGLWNSTEFLGTQRDIPGIMAELDVLVLATTTQEAFGRVIIEAQASGVPVVATSVGGVVDIIEHEKSGLLVAPADPQGMAEAVIRIYQDPAHAQIMAERAYQKVKEKYDLQTMVDNTLAVYEEVLHSSRILVIKLSSLGDIILSTAALQALREKFASGYRITFLVGAQSKEALMRAPAIDELLVADLAYRDRGWLGFWKLAAMLRQRHFDLVIDLQNNRASHLLSFLTLSPRRYGYRNNKLGFLLNCGIRDTPQPLPPVAHQFRILEPLGITYNGQQLGLWPAQEDARYVEEFLNSHWLTSHQLLVGINVSASDRWLTKAWSPSAMLKLVEELGQRHIRVVLTGTDKDAPSATTLANAVKSIKVINACGKTTVNQLACLIARCKVFISSDSAPLHVAAAMGVPFVSLFGPTDPKRHLPPAKRYEVITKNLECSPCYRRQCRSRRCMEQMSAEEVMAAVERLME